MKTKQTFKDFVSEFERLLKKRYGIDLNDCTDEDYLKTCYDGNETTEEVVEQIATKRNLDRIDSFY
jgi:hypothetical protein